MGSEADKYREKYNKMKDLYEEAKEKYDELKDRYTSLVEQTRRDQYRDSVPPIYAPDDSQQTTRKETDGMSVNPSQQEISVDDDDKGLHITIRIVNNNSALNNASGSVSQSIGEGESGAAGGSGTTGATG